LEREREDILDNKLEFLREVNKAAGDEPKLNGVGELGGEEEEVGTVGEGMEAEEMKGMDCVGEMEGMEGEEGEEAK